MFLAAAVLKIAGIHEFIATLRLLGGTLPGWPWGSFGMHASALAACIVIGWELLIGCLLASTRAGRATIVATLLTLLMFSGVLLHIGLSGNPIGCGCFGGPPVSREGSDGHLAMSLARNTASILLAGWLFIKTPRSAGLEGSQPRSNPRTHRSAAGFTIVEVLVVLVVVAVLLAILLPSLGKASDQARATVRLSQIRQIATMAQQYASDSDEYPPYLGIPGDPDAGLSIAEQLGVPHLHYLSNSSVYPYALEQTGHEVRGLLASLGQIPDLEMRAPGEQQRYRYSTSVLFTYTAVIDPAYWTADRPAPNHPSLFRGVRFTEALFPSSKVMLGDRGWPYYGDYSNQEWAVAMIDGHVSQRPVIGNEVRFPVLGIGSSHAGLNTTDGMRGRDYE